eukprot:scaffold63283_cov18-Tisochrysis_lutea.AAC.4
MFGKYMKPRFSSELRGRPGTHGHSVLTEPMLFGFPVCQLAKWALTTPVQVVLMFETTYRPAQLFCAKSVAVLTACLDWYKLSVPPTSSLLKDVDTNHVSALPVDLVLLTIPHPLFPHPEPWTCSVISIGLLSMTVALTF